MARNKFDVSERLESEFNLGHLKRVFRYVLKYKKQMIFTLIVIIAASVCNIVGPLIIKNSIDTIDKSLSGEFVGNMYLQLAIYAGLFLLAISGTSLGTRIKITLMSFVGQNVIADIRLDLFKHLQELPFTYYDSRPHGKILVRVVNYVNSLSDFLSSGVINLIAEMFSLCAIIVIMFSLDLWLSLICMLPLPFFIIFIVAIKKKHRKAWQEYSISQSNMNAYIHENILGIKVTQSFSRESHNMAIFREQCEINKKRFMSIITIEQKITPLVEMCSVIASVGLFIFAIPRLGENLSIGTLIAFTGYIGMFWTPIINLSNFYNQIMTAMAYLERIFEAMDEPVAIHDAIGASVMPRISGSVEFRNVDFSYEPNVPVLKDISFTVEAGQTIALVGPTGAGKTTIINLISRFYDVTAGAVLVEGIDIKDVTLKSLRGQMGVMLQDTFIFTGTIMDNIRYKETNATEEEIIAAAKAVCAHDFIMEQEGGYQTQVNERGSRLSVGQRQLISFARALLANPRILILDEATSSIDTKTELALQKGLDELLCGRTSFIIAHRLSTIKNADKIMYIDQNRIMESGTHDELMAKQGAYYNLCSSQYRFLQNI